MPHKQPFRPLCWSTLVTRIKKKTLEVSSTVLRTPSPYHTVVSNIILNCISKLNAWQLTVKEVKVHRTYGQLGNTQQSECR